MIRDLDQLKKITDDKIYYTYNTKIWDALEYRFGSRLEIDSALKNYKHLDKSTQKLLEILVAIEFLAEQKISVEDLHGNKELLLKAYKEALKARISFDYGNSFEKYLNNWGENQDFLYKGIDFSKCLHMRVAQNSSANLLKELQNAINQEL